MENNTAQPQTKTKFCKHCGGQIAQDAVICPLCGRQVETVGNTAEQPSIVINNTNSNINSNRIDAALAHRMKNKWVALLLCLFLGFLGGHKFYEGKIGLGIVYLLTCGLFGIGCFIDFIVLLFKPNPYFV